MDNQLIRTQMLIGEDAINKLKNSAVAVFGIGGVGGYTVEALARCGVGRLDLIDSDTIDITNLNRQIYALHSTIGMYKVEVAKNRILDINPNIKVNTYKTFYLPENANQFDLGLTADNMSSVWIRANRQFVLLLIFDRKSAQKK